jgi:hypothetical protein
VNFRVPFKVSVRIEGEKSLENSFKAYIPCHLVLLGFLLLFFFSNFLIINGGVEN